MTWLQPNPDTLVLVDHADAVVLHARRNRCSGTRVGFRWQCRYRKQRCETTDIDALKAWAERMARRYHGSEA